MALVVLLRGVNVGGRRRLRPTVLAEQLKHLEVVSIGAAGTFVIRQPVAEAQLREEFERRLPFEAEIMICADRDVLGLVARDPFADEPAGKDVVHFVSLLSSDPDSTLSMPVSFPPGGRWLLRILGRQGRLVFGSYRRQMKAIGYLGKIDDLFGVSATTRGWNTIKAISRVLEA